MARSEMRSPMKDAICSSVSGKSLLWEEFVRRRLRAWQPILAPRWVLSLYLVCGAGFVAVGIALLLASWDVVEHTFDYTDCFSVPSEQPSTDGCTFNHQYKTGSFEIEVTRDVEPPIWVYYQLEGFHQNHRRYVKSRDDSQLRDGGSMAPQIDSGQLSSCKPWITSDDRVNYPCGQVARTVFNDTYELQLRESDAATWQRLSVDSSARMLAWSADVEGRFHNLDPEATPHGSQNQVLLNMWAINIFPPVECRHVNITDVYRPARVGSRAIAGSGGAMQSDCENYMVNGGAPSCRFEVKGSNDTFNCVGEYEEVAVSDWGIESGHFIVWMRTAGLPTFRKLWGKVGTPLKAGSRLRVFFEDNFPVVPFRGRKAFVLSTSNALGGRNDFLGLGYIVVGACCLVFCLVFFCLPSRRKGQNPSSVGPLRDLQEPL